MKSNVDRGRRTLRCGAALAASLLVACGGGSQVQTFEPNRIIAFGDESSVIDDVGRAANGRKYSVNATVSDTDPTIACDLNPLWIQVVATAHNLVFPQCNRSGVASPTSRIRATAGARVADLSTQIDAQLAESPFTGREFATVLIGQNDILDQYKQYPAVGETQLTTNVEALGTALGTQVNRIADGGAKVLLSTVLDLGLTPYATAEKAAHTDADRAALLSRLTARFNAAMRATILNDGRKIGLILADEFFSAVVKISNGGGFTNVVTPVCDLTRSALVPPSVLDCTNLTLVSGGSATTYLYADTLLLSAGGQQSLGTLAAARATNNPF